MTCRVIPPFQSGKMEALQRLANGVAHELNNLLTAITGNLQFLESQKLPPDQMMEIIADVQRAVSQGIELSRRLRAYGGQQDLRPENFDLRELVETVCESAAPETLLRVLHLPPGRQDVFVDRGRMQAALAELARNAHAAMPGGGSLTFAIEASACDTVRLTITDTGPGMAPEVLEKALDPLFTTAHAQVRAGWGLSLAAAFIRQSGGSLTLCPIEAGGLRVAIVLPRAPDQLADTA